MSKPSFSASKIALLGLGLLVNQAQAQAPQISGFTPGRHSLSNDTTTAVTIQFDQDMNAATLDSPNFLIYGERTGFHAGNYSYDAGSRTASFTPAVAFEAGEMVIAILTQSILNNSGVPLASAFQWSFFVKTVSGTAKFELDSTYAADNGPHFVGIAELTGGGGQDIAIPHSKDANFRTWLNTGTGDFSRDTNYTVGNSPRSLTIGDFDQDNDLDLAVANENANTVSIADNDGSGGYTVRGSVIAVGNSPVHLTVGDLDGDGFMDLVVVNGADNDISVFLNAGNGTFPNRVDYQVQTTPQSAFVADFNNDGFPDIVVANSSSATVSLLLNDGTGDFGTPDNSNSGNGPRVVLGHDYDQDGFLDVATVNRGGSSISILLNNQTGSFSGKTDFAAGADPFGMAVGDLDGDTDPDVVVSNKDDNNVQVLLNDGSGGFTSDSTYATGLQPRSLALGDLNRDGILDIASAAWDSDQLHVFFNGSFPVLNDAPAAPTLNTPADLTFLNQSVTPLVLNWNVPVDNDGDSLHFLVEISQVADFASTVLSADSRSDVTGFSPTPPVAQTVSDVSYAASASLADGSYYWRVTAHDGTVFGPASGSRKLTVDGTDPNIDSVSLTNPTPGFLPNWYNQNTVATVDLIAQYDESRAQSALFDLGALGGTQQITGIASGLDQTTQVQLGITGAADGSYPLSVTVFDSAGNSVAANSSIALDGTAPTGAVASSPATSQQLTFTVDWAGTASDGSGSGLSGSYDVQFQIGGGPWVPWRTNLPGTSSSFTGEQGASYGFEAAAHDNVDNVEAFLDIAETTTLVDTVTDNTAPGPPVSLEANTSNPSPWQNNPLYTITWDNPQDASGIERALFKLGAPPTANFDTSGSVAGATAFIAQATAENGQDLHLWLVDNTGNVDFQNRAAVTLRYDATAPTGTQASSPSVSINPVFAVTWTGSGDDGAGSSGLSGIYDVKVQTNGGLFQDWLVNFPGTSADFTGVHGNNYGFEVVAHDVAGNVEAFTQTAESTTLVDSTAGDVTAPGPPTLLLANGSNPSAWQAIPNFLVSWQAPSDPSGIAAALYKLGSAPTANFDTTGAIRQGNSLNLAVTQEDGQSLYLWFQDQRGNLDFNNAGSINLRYDNTQPEIFEMDFVNADFGLDWYNQANTALAQTVLEYTETHASTATLTSTDLDTVIEVQGVPSGQDVPVSFNLSIAGRADGLYHVKFAVSDSAGSSDTDSTRFRLDATAPTGTTVSAPDTSRDEAFVISWNGSGTDGAGSGLSGIYDVRFREDGDDWEDLLTSFTGTSTTFQGDHGLTYDFEVVAYDNVGNIESFLNTPEATTIVDTGFTDVSGPQIQHSTPNTVAQGAGVQLQIQAQDNNQIVEAKLFFRGGGTLDYTERIMTSSDGSTFTASLSEAELTANGVNYFFRVSDGSNVAFLPEEWQTTPFNLSVTIVGNDSEGVVNATAQPSGQEVVAFRMISVPLNLSDKAVTSVLEDDLGPYDPAKWRLFQFNTASNEYIEFPNVSAFDPFRALWLIVRDADKVIDTGPGTTVRTNEPFTVTLNRGWNDIGMSFPFPIDAASVQVIQGDANDVVGPYHYQGSWLLPDQVPQLRPWEGYSFFSESDGVRLAITPTASIGSLSKTNAERADAIDWALGITATSDFLSDRIGRLGVADDATEVRDKHDFLEPPFPGDFISVRFPHTDWDRLAGYYKTDFRPSFDDGEVWSFEVTTTLENKTVQLDFTDLPSLPARFEVVLVDKATLRQIDIRQSATYSFIQKDGEAREFDLLVGTADYLATSEALNSIVPQSSSLLPNYPNPFNAGTTITYHLAEAGSVTMRILNILGQQVRTLTQERQEAGVYKVQWDGRDGRGVEIGTGVYFVRLEANRFTQTRKILLVR